MRLRIGIRQSDLKKLSDAALKSGEHVFAGEVVVLIERAARAKLGAGRAIDANGASIWADDPDQLHACAQVVPDFFFHLRSQISGRENLDGQIRSDSNVTGRGAIIGQSAASHERDVGFAKLIGIVRKAEVSAVCGENVS